MPRKTAVASLADLPPLDRESGDVNAIIETPKGSRTKFDYDPDLRLFKLGSMLPEGSNFPFNFGFIPSTLGEDGDPLDLLVLMEEPAFTGCLVPSRLVGVIEGEQTDEDGTSKRNDRLIATASHSREHADVDSLKALSPHVIAEIEHFFVSYNEVRGKKFRPLGRHGAKRAKKLLEAGRRRRRRARAGGK
jgi:inorganic pyrophosphatase